jgi:hypothetical protein
MDREDVVTCGQEGRAREDKAGRWVPADQVDRWVGRASAEDRWAVEVLAEEDRWVTVSASEA